MNKKNKIFLCVTILTGLIMFGLLLCWLLPSKDPRMDTEIRVTCMTTGERVQTRERLVFAYDGKAKKFDVQVWVPREKRNIPVSELQNTGNNVPSFLSIYVNTMDSREPLKEWPIEKGHYSIYVYFNRNTTVDLRYYSCKFGFTIVIT